MRWIVPAFAAALVTATAFPESSMAQRAYAPLARGQQLLKEHCASCHQIGWGASPNKEALPFRELLKRYPANAIEEALAEGLLNGHAPGAEFEFEATEVDAIVRYLSTLGGKR